MSSKLKNIEAVQKLLAGEHKTQTRKTFGFSDVQSTAEKNKKREVGEIWEEVNAETGTVTKWEQMNGYRRKIQANMEVLSEVRQYINSFPNCPKETCTCTKPTHVDIKFRKIAGKCSECVIQEETRMKIAGTFNEYAKQKMRSNAEQYFIDADKEVEIVKEVLRNPMKFLENDQGSVETWNSTNPEYLVEQIDNQYSDFKEKVFKKLEE